MPSLPPRLCGCGRTVAGGDRCQCKRAGDRARKARHDAKRPTASARGYGQKWRAARVEFLAARPMCAMPDCGAPATVVDHIMPHRGDLKLFWNRRNWQPLCEPCHNRRKQAMERGGFQCL